MIQYLKIAIAIADLFLTFSFSLIAFNSYDANKLQSPRFGKN